MMHVEVVDIRKSSGDGKTRAIASIKFGGSLIIPGFSVVEGLKGTFVSLPRRLGKDGRWADTITVDDFLRQQVEDKVLQAYEEETDGVKA